MSLSCLNLSVAFPLYPMLHWNVPSRAIRTGSSSLSCLANLLSHYSSPFSPPSHLDVQFHENAKAFPASGTLGDAAPSVLWFFRLICHLCFSLFPAPLHVIVLMICFFFQWLSSQALSGSEIMFAFPSQGLEQSWAPNRCSVNTCYMHE